MTPTPLPVSTPSRAQGPRRDRLDRPNIVLVCVDQMRGDALSAAGHPVVRTPHLDELARNGTRFSRAYSATPSCVPARVGLFTGQSSARHGRYGYRDGVPFRAAHPVTLPSVLRENGYQTQAIGKMHVFPERARCGFDDVRLHDGFMHFGRRYGGRNLIAHDDYLTWLQRQPGVDAHGDYFDDGVGCNSMVALPWTKPEPYHPTNWVVTEAIDWLYRRDPEQPFLLYLSFHRPHAPFNPPQWAFDRYLDGPRVEPPRGDWSAVFDDVRTDGFHQMQRGRQDPESHHRTTAGYYGNITHIDQQLNRFFEALADFELSEDTAVVFVSDHGDMMGDHDFYRKSVPYEGSSHVPFIVSPARRFAPDAERGQVRDEVVELRDVMPTLLEMAGVEVPDTVDGRSVLGLATGDDRGPWRDEIHGEHTYFGQSLQWVTDGKRKFCWASERGEEQFFDLEADPAELTNLVDDPARADEVADWRQRLVSHLTDREEGFVSDGSLVPGRPVRSEAGWVADLVPTA
ncbi:MAG TPA: arylsulfatase [Candidatus Avipropionibacterium avicola]|uniref:Arylsulfatase n=1 Tax=Candidatus Avipropionibacterium avicola TaxID=2840701 RepID=A0A9D1KN48_9ACTN|nr:arylsulfatase [Candidatus Avipropionibacterium avicola]